MAIHIDIFAQLHKREAQREADQLADIYERAGVKAGESAGDGVAKGLQKASPKVQKAMTGLVSAKAATVSALDAYNKQAEKSILIDNDLAQSRDKVAQAQRREKDATLATREAVYALAQFRKSGREDAEKEAILIERVSRAKRAESTATEGLKASLLAEQKAKNAAAFETQRSIQLSNALTVAKRREGDAHRSTASAIRDYVRDARNTDGVIDNLAGNLQALGKTALPVARGLALIAAPAIVAALVDTAKVAVTASQSIYLLPAAATAAAAGMGTLQLATAGFANAIKDIRDPKKFATDLASLAPSAQQAALEIRNILPELDKLQQATQNAFFDGFGQKIDQLSATFLPGVQKLTTDIATTFNQSLTGIGDLLMTPENQANIGTVMTNIGDAFRAAAPAAQSFAQAFIDITTAGSSFLPGLGNDLATVAREFANFIAQARQTGQLQEWIQEGIDAVKAIGTAIWDIGAAIYDVFGRDGKKNVEDFVATARLTIEVTRDLMIVIRSVGDFISGNTSYAHAFNDAVADWPEAVHAAGNAFVDFANIVKNALLNGPVKAFNVVIEKITEVLNLLPGPDKPLDFGKIPEIPDIPYGPSMGNWDTYAAEHGQGPPPQDQVGIANNRYSGPSDQASGFQRWTDPKTGKVNVLVPGLGWVPEDDPRAQGAAGRPYGGPFDVPAAPTKKDNSWSAPTDQWSLQNIPVGSFPGVGAPAGGVPSINIAPGALNGTPGAMGPKGPIDPQDAWDAQSRLQSAGFKVEETRQRYLELAHDNTTSETDLLKSKHDIAEAERDYISAEMKAAEVAQGKFKKMSTGMNEIGATLDADFGLSEGLPGLAKNITMFVGNLLAAPELMKLQGITDAAEAQGQPKGGFGLLGILGAQNMMQGKSPLFGNPVGTDTSGYTVGGPTGVQSPRGATGSGTGGPVGTAMPGESARDFAHRVMQPFWQSQGLTVGDHGADKSGEHQNGALDIMVPNLAEGSKVLQQVLSDPNVYGAIFNNQTYGYGHGATPQDYSAGHTGDPSQDHTNHVHAWYKPGGTNNITPMTPEEAAAMASGMPTGSTGSTAMPGIGSGSLPIPLPVTIVGGMPGGGGGGIPVPGSGGGSGAVSYTGADGTKYGANGLPIGAPGGGGSGLNFDALAAKESSGNWAANTGNGYYGGLQFDEATWKQYAGDKLAPRADLASKEDQIAIAKKAYDARGDKGASLWPQNYGQLNAAGIVGGGIENDHGGNGMGWAGQGAGMFNGFGSSAGPNAFNSPTGGGRFSPGMQLDTSTTSTSGPMAANGGRGPRAGEGVDGGMGMGPNGTPLGIVGSNWNPSGTAAGGGELPYSPPGSGQAPGSLPGGGGIFAGPYQAPPSIGPGPIGLPYGPPTPPQPAPGPGGGGIFAGPYQAPPSIGPGPIGGGVGPNLPIGGPAQGAGPGQTGYGGVDPGVAMGGTGGIGASDSTMALAGMAASALDVMAPGAGQAAQIGMKLANRAIQYGGQLAGIGVSGLMETFLPTGGSELANGGWIPRIAGGLAGAKPALPNVAGGKSGTGVSPGPDQAPGPLTPDQAKGGIGQGAGQPAPTINTTINNNNASPDQNAAQANWHAGQAYSGGMR